MTYEKLPDELQDLIRRVVPSTTLAVELTEFLPEAMRLHKRLCRSADERVRLRAIELLYQRTLGNPEGGRLNFEREFGAVMEAAKRFVPEDRLVDFLNELGPGTHLAEHAGAIPPKRQRKRKKRKAKHEKSE